MLTHGGSADSLVICVENPEYYVACAPRRAASTFVSMCLSGLTETIAERRHDCRRGTRGRVRHGGKDNLHYCFVITPIERSHSFAREGQVVTVFEVGRNP